MDTCCQPPGQVRCDQGGLFFTSLVWPKSLLLGVTVPQPGPLPGGERCDSTSVCPLGPSLASKVCVTTSALPWPVRCDNVAEFPEIPEFHATPLQSKPTSSEALLYTARCRACIHCRDKHSDQLQPTLLSTCNCEQGQVNTVHLTHVFCQLISNGRW